jgi:hypothetical protein
MASEIQRRRVRFGDGEGDSATASGERAVKHWSKAIEVVGHTGSLCESFAESGVLEPMTLCDSIVERWEERRVTHATRYFEFEAPTQSPRGDRESAGKIFQI